MDRGIREATWNMQHNYMDFQKAIAKVPHSRLLKKMEKCDKNGNILSWVSDFLTNRTQRIIVQGETSKWADVTFGILQGSIIEPLLFVIYINNLPESNDSDAYFFADDTKISKLSLMNMIMKNVLET